MTDGDVFGIADLPLYAAIGSPEIEAAPRPRAGSRTREPQPAGELRAGGAGGDRGDATAPSRSIPEV